MSHDARGDEVGEKPALFVSAEMDDVEVWTVAGGTAVVFSACSPDRKQNQDCAAVVRIDDDAALLAVADGVGGERGGARARVEVVEVPEVRSVTAVPGGGFVADAVWIVGGTVTHFGHRHYRRNRYDARVRLVPVDGIWKIDSVEVHEEERLQ